MDYQKLEILLKSAPSLKLLRSRNAPLILSFLYSQFKEQGEISISNEKLTNQLAWYLEELNYSDEDDDLTSFGSDNYERAKKYIESWTNDNFLRNYIDDIEKTVYNVLTQHTERVFQMLDFLQERKFVGTESKFKDIFHKLKELVDNNTEDPKKKIEELEERKKKIDEEIRRIRRDGNVVKFEDYQIQSRFEDISRLTNELIGDFKEVEDIFKMITRDIYEKQSQYDLSKGRILHYTFDALDSLKESDQGKSFYAFWNFLIDEDSQDTLKMLIKQVSDILEDRGIEYNNRNLKRIKTILFQSGRKVLDSNNLLAEKLTRVIAEKHLLESRKIRETMAEIKQISLRLIEHKIPENYGIEIELEAKIDMPMERKLGEEKIIPEFDITPETFNSKADLESMSNLFNPDSINIKELIGNINSLLTDKQQVTLEQVIEKYPISKGLGELIGYISLINSSEKYFVNEEISDLLLFDVEENKYLKMPQIIYCR
ncbi:MAG: DUF3375 domain-containing protein [Macellibacteroides sp.]|uniref:DUF3375 domain-containing protein n=1 Tax=Macellibacteroides sp. TaxID=2014584 RepID=UPI003E7BA181